MVDPRVELSPFMDWQEANRRLLGGLESRKLKAALFACGKRVNRPEGKSLLGAWDDASHLICNHSYSHLMYLRETSDDDFVADF
jgi:hypothetical protein